MMATLVDPLNGWPVGQSDAPLVDPLISWPVGQKEKLSVPGLGHQVTGAGYQEQVRVRVKFRF
jgi:hypothetical protein